MASRAARMIRRAADRGPRTRAGVQDGWTAVRPARTIIQDRPMTARDTVRVPGRAPAAWTTWEA
jgi:hypothetical protein